MSNPRPLTLTDPLDIDEARKAARLLAGQRREAETTLENLTKAAADKEATYRRALAEAFIRTEGTAAEREATARSQVADKSYERDVAAGMVKVQTERLRGLEGERAMLRAITEWSMRIDEEQRERIGKAA